MGELCQLQLHAELYIALRMRKLLHDQALCPALHPKAFASKPISCTAFNPKTIFLTERKRIKPNISQVSNRIALSIKILLEIAFNLLRGNAVVIEVIGHRGAAGLEPENTLRSIRRAIEIGVDRVEIDVRVTKDGRLVVIHDETVDRTTNGHGYVRDMTFEEIRKLDAGKGEKVPTLEEALNLTRGKVILQIELKVAEATEPTIELIEENGAEREVVITSFIHSLLKKVRYLNPAIRTGALFFDVQEDIFERTISACAEAIHIYYRNITPKLVENAHKRGLKVVAWNPDEVGDMKRIISLGVDAIGSNRPDILINLLREMGMR